MILLVEDNPDDAVLINHLLESMPTESAQTRVANRLSEALTLMATEPPQLVLLDLGLPDTEGLQGLTQLLRAAPDVPIVVVTGEGDEELAVAAVRAGAQDFLVKGKLDAASLSRVMRQSVERHRRLQDMGAALLLQQFRATHDELTGLPNRVLFRDRLMHAIECAMRERRRLAVVYMDLDGFKPVNDTLGHAAGDELLVQFAAHLGDCLRRCDTIARLGGDEFGLLLEDVRTRRTVADVIEQARAAFNEPIPVHGQPCAINFSAGIAVFPEDGLDADRLLRSADLAMYRDKGNRRQASRTAARETIRSRRWREGDSDGQDPDLDTGLGW